MPNAADTAASIAAATSAVVAPSGSRSVTSSRSTTDALDNATQSPPALFASPAPHAGVHPDELFARVWFATQSQRQAPENEEEFAGHGTQAVIPAAGACVLNSQLRHGLLDRLVWNLPGVHITHISVQTTGDTQSNNHASAQSRMLFVDNAFI